MADTTKIVTTLLGFAVFFGILTMVLKNPSGSNALLSAGADSIDGVTKALEGR